MKRAAALVGCVDEDILDLSEIERRIYGLRRKFFIKYSTASKIIDKFEDLLLQPKSDRMRGMLLYGVSDNGKSSIAKMFRSRHPARDLSNGNSSVIPVVYMVAPDSASDTKFYAELIKSIYAPTKLAATANMRFQAVTMLEKVKARMLIVDEIQQVITGGGNRQKAMLNALKTVASLARVAVVAIGVRQAKNAIEYDAQLADRLERVLLPIWQRGPQWSQLLNTFASEFGFKSSGLGQEAMSKKIHAMTEGLLGYAARLLTDAAVKAVRTGQDRITPALLDSLGFLSPREQTGCAPD
jgi:hypothetical protein